MKKVGVNIYFINRKINWNLNFFFRSCKITRQKPYVFDRHFSNSEEKFYKLQNILFLEDPGL